MGIDYYYLRASYPWPEQSYDPTYPVKWTSQFYTISDVSQVSYLSNLAVGVERNMKQRDPVNSRTSWNVFATLLCIRFNWSFFAINSLNESLSSCIRKKNSLSGYPVLSEIRMQRWGKRYRRDQNFLSAYKHWKQESEISIQYFEFHFLISAIIFSSWNMNRKLGYTGTNGILVIDLNAL